MKAFWAAKNALMQKPDDERTESCSSCHGEGCRTCRGWGWTTKANACMLPATGHPCGVCAGKVGCAK